MRLNNRWIKRLSGIFLGLVMILGTMTTTAFASDGSATITINKGSVTTAWTGMQVHAYQVLDQVNPDETVQEKKQYQVTEAFEQFFNMNDEVKKLFEGNGGKVYLKYDENNRKLIYSEQTSEGAIAISDAKLDTTYQEADIVSRIEGSGQTAKNGDIATFYTWIEKYIEDTDIEETALETVSADSVVLGNLQEGFYALTFSNVPTGISVIQGILVATPGNIDLKAEDIPLTKQVKNTDHSNEDFNEAIPLKETTADIGDTLDYQITSKIPILTDTDNLTVFKLEDTMQNQQLTGTMTLTLSKTGVADIVYTAQIPESAEEGPVYFTKTGENKKKIAALTITDYADKKQSFFVDFLPTDKTQQGNITDLLTNYQGYAVKLEYQANVTADAVKVNGNDVKLLINNNGDDTENTDHTEVYTYGIQVQKKFSDQRVTDKKVTFQLRTDKTQEGSAISMGETEDGNYHVKTADDTTHTTNLKLDESGKLTITGLDAGTYWLVETEVPSGFTKADPIEIVLTPNKEQLKDGETTAKVNGETSVAGAQVDNSTLSVSVLKFDVLNQKGFSLPATGGEGTWMLTIGGIVLIVAAAGLFVASRKRSSSR